MIAGKAIGQLRQGVNGFRTGCRPCKFLGAFPPKKHCSRGLGFFLGQGAGLEGVSPVTVKTVTVHLLPQKNVRVAGFSDQVFNWPALRAVGVQIGGAVIPALIAMVGRQQAESTASALAPPPR